MNINCQVLMICLFLFLLSGMAAQSGYVTFIAENSRNHAPVELDSIRITHDQGLDTVIYSDTFWIYPASGISEGLSSNMESMLVRNYPNPFRSQTRFKMRISQPGSFRIRLFNLLGSILLVQEISLSAGDHEFFLEGEGLCPGIYFINVAGSSHSWVFKILKLGPQLGREVLIHEAAQNLFSPNSPSGLSMYGTIPVLNYTFTAFARNYLNQTISDNQIQSGKIYSFELDPATQAPVMDSIRYRQDSLRVDFSFYFSDPDRDLATLELDSGGDQHWDSVLSILQTTVQGMAVISHQYPGVGQYCLQWRLIDQMGFFVRDSLKFTVEESDTVTTWNPSDFQTVYDVGPGHEFPDPAAVPWESLTPSTLVRIYWQEEPYCCKWVINTEATADSPLVITGIADNGRLPVISGENAITRLELDYWNENRSVIKVGGSSLPDDSRAPAWIYIENLDIRSARPGYAFTDDRGNSGQYVSNAAAIHVEIGENINIKHCELHDCGNGLFTTYTTQNIRIAGNYIHDNGIEGSYYEHNTYTESQGIVYEYNRFSPLRPGCGGNNLKDRSSGAIIRYNWIESGNRQLDLVETSHQELAEDPDYMASWVYGNILIEPEDAGNNQIIHYGGDGGDTTLYRTGTLYFYHNTIVSTRSGNTTLIRLSLNGISADIRNNIVYASAGGNRMAITAGQGQARLYANWLSSGWKNTHESVFEGNLVQNGNLSGESPGFSNPVQQEFGLEAGSPCIDAGWLLYAPFNACPALYQYVKHQTIRARNSDAAPDIGAFEYGMSSFDILK